MWNTFWNSTFSANVPESDRVSQYSDTRLSNVRPPASLQNVHDQESMITPDLSISQHNLPVTVPTEFSFKLRDMMALKSKIYRFRADSANLKELYEKVLSRTKYTSDFLKLDGGNMDIIGPQNSRLCYLDDEGDVVSIESDMDLKEAVTMAVTMRLKQLVVYLGEPPSTDNSRCSTPNVNLEEPVIESKGSLDFLVGLPPAINVAIAATIVVASFYVIKKIAN